MHEQKFFFNMRSSGFGLTGDSTPQHEFSSDEDKVLLSTGLLKILAVDELWPFDLGFSQKYAFCN
jgi:hypothetical protein